MANIISVILGLIAFVIAFVGLIIGALNWLAIPIALVGLIIGLLSEEKKTGRNVCIAVLVIAIVRLFIGGGLL